MIPGIKVDTGAKPLAGYPGETVTEGLDGLRAAYGQKLGRLMALKTKYDPTNLFRMNQNIAPPSAAGVGA